MVGSSILRNFKNAGYTNLLLFSSKEYDLRSQIQVEKLFKKYKPYAVIIAAARVGGILANNEYRAEFIYDNLMIQSNIIHSSYMNNIEKLLFLGSSCIYPKYSKQPISEENLLSGYLEYTNEPYAVAKIAGIKLCENYYKQYNSNFFSLMPANLYGYNDNFNLETSHVLPALLRKFHDAKIMSKNNVEVWGTGNPKREFMFVDDLSKAILFLFENINAEQIYNQGISHLNIGSGKEVTIKELTKIISEIVEYNGDINFDLSKPDGTPRKLMDSSRIKSLGWESEISIYDGIKKTYDWYLKNKRYLN